MIFQQFRHEEGGCLSYLLGCTQTGVCAIVDPQFDAALYTKYAADHHLTITHVFETHAQADHLSGARKLLAETGAAVHYYEKADARFPITKVKDGDTLMVVEWTPNADTDTSGYDVMVDRIPGQEGAAANAAKTSWG